MALEAIRGGSQLFPVVDRLTTFDWEKLGIPLAERRVHMTSLGIAVRNVHAIFTGEKRCPRAGEWYLSGSLVEAYRAPNDLSTSFHIAELVRTVTETHTITRRV